MLENGAFYKPIHRKETKTYRGFDYHGEVMKRSLSAQMLDKNDNLYDFIMQLENVVDMLIDSCKTVHIFTSIARDKNDMSLN